MGIPHCLLCAGDYGSRPDVEEVESPVPSSDPDEAKHQGEALATVCRVQG